MCIRRLLACCAALASCATVPAMQVSENETRAIEHELHQRFSAYADANVRFDTTAVLSFWADVPDFTMAGDGQLTVGYAPWADHLRGLFKEFKKTLYFETFNAHPYVLSRDAAVYTTEFRWGFVQANNDTLRASGSWSYMLRKLGNDWKVVHSAGTHVLQSSKAAADDVAALDSIAAALSELASAISRRDADLAARRIREDDHIVYVSDGMAVRGRDYRAVLRGFYATTRNIEFAWDSVDVRLVDTGTAVATGWAELAITDNTGQAHTEHAVSTMMFVRRQSHWEMLLGQKTTLPDKREGAMR